MKRISKIDAHQGMEESPILNFSAEELGSLIIHTVKFLLEMR
ncbi:hypothetical protein [Pseudalkalibacillus salsuginis]|nr:hypothetical protein [Pseudalkalibacillus salsuginis]